MFLASTIKGGVLDLIVLCLLIFVSLIGLKQGFINRLVGIVAGILSLVIAFTCCKPFANLLNITFNMQNALTGSLSKAFAKNDGFNVTITDIDQVKNLLDNQNLLPSFIKNAVLKINNFAGDKTLAQLLGEVCAKFVVLAISFIILWLLVRLACVLLKFGFAKIEDKHDGIFLANKLLGVCLGFFQCLVVIYVIIFLVTVLPSSIMGWLQNIIDQSKICKFLSNYNLFAPIFSLFANL